MYEHFVRKEREILSRIENLMRERSPGTKVPFYFMEYSDNDSSDRQTFPSTLEKENISRSSNLVVVKSESVLKSDEVASSLVKTVTSSDEFTFDSSAH